MKFAKVIPFVLMGSAIALGTGCAADDGDGAEAGDEANLTTEASLKAELGGAVGALVVNGERLCTAALVRAAAGAKIQVNGAEISAEGRQVVFGGACVGKLSGKQKDFVGAAVFVSQKGGVTIKTPIIGFDFQSQASAGLAIGILGTKSEATPIELLGASASAGVSGSVGAIIRANDKDGLVVGAGFEVQGGFDVAFKTKCTSLKAGASVGVGASASIQLKGGDEAAAIVKINGKFHFAAYLELKVDGQCVFAKTIEALNQFGEQLNSAHIGEIVSMQYHPGPGSQKMSVFLEEEASFIRINTAGSIRGETSGIKCRKLAITGTPCELFAPNGFKRGWHTINVDLGLLVIPNPERGQLVVFSTSDKPVPLPGQNDNFGGGG
jgi:hypothetical protein